MIEYKNFLSRIILNGMNRKDRTGVGTISRFGERMEFDLSEGFPATTTKKLAWKAVVSELLWFISGSGDERYLCDILHGTRDVEKSTIWTENANADYWKKGVFEGDLGVVYGNMWRKWPVDTPSYEMIDIRPMERVTRILSSDEIYDILNTRNPYETGSYEYKIYDFWRTDVIARHFHDFYTISDDWLEFDTFKNSIKNVPGFYNFMNAPYDYELSPTYYGANQFSMSTSIFIPKEYAREIDREMIDPCDSKIRRRIFFVDQLDELIKGLKKDPFGRRHIISAWNPGQLKSMALPPCHIMAQFYVREVDGIKFLDCQMYQRSADAFLGVPFNIASYALFTHMIAHVIGMNPGKFIHSIGDAHIYSNHVEAVEELMNRECFPLPSLKIKRRVESIEDFKMSDFELTDYQCHATIKAPMAV